MVQLASPALKIPQMSEEVINYVIGRPWDSRDPHNLCVYYLQGEIHRGTIADAMQTLERVHNANPGFEYAVYEVFYRKLS